MEHVAILNPKMAKIEDILCGDKTIESRWYKHKIAPWGKIEVGDNIYFKKAGGYVMAKAKVSKVLQFENLSQNEIENIYDRYTGKGKINLKITKDGLIEYCINKKYIILIFLTKIESIKPFNINKKGFGISCAWLYTDNINKIKLPLS